MAGARVAWAVVRSDGRRVTGVVRIAALRRPRRVLRRLTVLPERRRSYLPEVGVALTTRGELAWLAAGRVVVRSSGGRREVIARGDLDALGLEDDRTLRWRDGAVMVYRDLRPWPVRGCPRRERFGIVLGTAEVLVTQAHYGGDGFFGSTITRACVRATAQERILGQTSFGLGDGGHVDPVGASGTWVVSVRTSMSRYDGCVDATVRAVEVVTGTEGRSGSVPWCQPSLLPDEGEPVAVTDRGIPAWIVRDRAGSRVLFAGADHVPTELDRGGRDSIAALRAEGSRVLWTRDGEPRTAELG